MRLTRLFLPVALVTVVWLGAAPRVSGKQPPPLQSLLGAAAAYVAAYEEQASAVVFEERYEQRVTRLPNSFQDRWLRSEVVVLNTGDFGWIGFRDVFEVDGKPVQDRQNRLQALFVQPLADAIVRARTVADESARFNLGSVHRDLNFPTLALRFLRQAHQGRSAFSREGSARVTDVPTWIVSFQEVERPTLIGSRAGNVRVGDVVTSGRFWIEPDNGRVRRSHLTVELEHATGIYDVVYGPWAGLDMLMPVSMEENFSVRASSQQLAQTIGDIRPVEVLRGQARYSNFKRFTVDVQTAKPTLPQAR